MTGTMNFTPGKVGNLNSITLLTQPKGTATMVNVCSFGGAIKSYKGIINKATSLVSAVLNTNQHDRASIQPRSPGFSKLPSCTTVTFG